MSLRKKRCDPTDFLRQTAEKRKNTSLSVIKVLPFNRKTVAVRAQIVAFKVHVHRAEITTEVHFFPFKQQR